MIIRIPLLVACLTLGATSMSGVASGGEGPSVKITPSLESITVKHQGREVTIQRNQDKEATISAAYAKTSRPCPPFCIQPASVAPGVETVAELEVLGYLKRVSEGDDTVLVVDSRTPDWQAHGSIPGSVNIPWTRINVDMAGAWDVAAEADSLGDVLEHSFGARRTADGWDFSAARTLVLFCNGLWCAQSSINVKTLLKAGYPASKLKWYRGGMQAWESVGLTTTRDLR